MNRSLVTTTACAFVIGAGSALADTFTLRSGEAVDGTFRGASGTSIHVETEEGLRRLPIADVASVTFSPRSVAERHAVRARGTRAVIVGTDAELEVDLPAPVRDGTVGPGESFTGSLASALNAGPVLAAPAGTPVHGEVVGLGEGKLVLAINEMEVGGETVPIRLRTYTLDIGGDAGDTARFRVQQPFALRVEAP